MLGRDDNTVRVLDRNGTLLWTAKAGNWVTSVDVSDDGSTIVAGSMDRNLYVFDRAGNRLGTFTADAPIKSRSVGVSGDGSVIAAADLTAVYGFSRSQFEQPVTTAPPTTVPATTLPTTTAHHYPGARNHAGSRHGNRHHSPCVPSPGSPARITGDTCPVPQFAAYLNPDSFFSAAALLQRIPAFFLTADKKISRIPCGPPVHIPPPVFCPDFFRYH